MKADWENRTLFHGDNLAFLRGIDNETIDLIATDPPFNKGRDFHATPESLAQGASFQDRWSWEEDVHQDWIDEIKNDRPPLMEAIESARHAHSDGMGAFMCFLSVRLLEMNRILKTTGSVFIHCDQTASHYIKAVMDAVFGAENFLNEIVWSYKTGGVGKKWFGRKHDVILAYAKKLGRHTFNVQKEKSYTKARGRRPGVVNLGQGEATFHEDENGVYSWTHMRDVWEISYINSQSSERTGYPTQKPLELYERIIKAASNKGDVVLDPFAGCATTCVAAENLERQWLGMDLWKKTAEVIYERMQAASHHLDGGKIRITQAVPQRTDDGQTAAPYLKATTKKIDPDEGPRMSNAEMKASLVEDYGVVCQGCRRQFDASDYLELDHEKPRSDGGANSINNRTLLCKPCNGLKSNDKTMSGLVKAIRAAANDSGNPRHIWAKQSPVLNNRT